MNRFYVELNSGLRLVAFSPKRSNIAKCFPVSGHIEAAEWDSKLCDDMTAEEMRADQRYLEQCRAAGCDGWSNAQFYSMDNLKESSRVMIKIDSGYHKVGPFDVFVVNGRVSKIWNEDGERVWIYTYSPEQDCYINQSGLKFSSFKTLVYSDKELKIED